MKTVLFYWSKGSEVRVKIVKLVSEYNASGRPVFSNQLAKELGLSHVAVNKHLDLLTKHGFVKIVNPGGKPLYLELTQAGDEVVKEFTKKPKNSSWPTLV
ncbi:MAG TPA: winged helix-turn-helix domain-containing protein [archaeon]|nr:winged helix-turn-helix domain-containing protein [archaeon]HLD81464.1 winged helix-turn-helix domain-containing protein [archaeon]